MNIALAKINANNQNLEEVSDEFRTHVKVKLRLMTSGISEYKRLIENPETLKMLQSVISDSDRKISSYQRTVARAHKHLARPAGQNKSISCPSEESSICSKTSFVASSKSDAACRIAEAKVKTKFVARQAELEREDLLKGNGWKWTNNYRDMSMKSK